VRDQQGHQNRSKAFFFFEYFVSRHRIHSHNRNSRWGRLALLIEFASYRFACGAKSRMPIFSRRRVQSMLDELANDFQGQKRTDIVKRLNDKRADQALPAEMELALIWAVKSVGAIEIEPEWWPNTKRPDVITDQLIFGRKAAIEIAAHEDNSLSGKSEMEAIALQISDCANKARKNSGDVLFYYFGVDRKYVDKMDCRNGPVPADPMLVTKKYVRFRLAPNGFILSKEMRAQIEHWVTSSENPAERLVLQAHHFHVAVERKATKQARHYNYHCSMPPETPSLENNPLFKLLWRKRKQLSAAPVDMYRMIFVADSGSTLLNKIGGFQERDKLGSFVSGTEIIQHFIAKSNGAIDAVVVFCPYSERSVFGQSSLFWRVTFFHNDKFSEVPDSLNRIASALPAPRYTGDLARQVFRHGAFSPAAGGQYLGGRGTLGKEQPEIAISSRLLLDLLAGRISKEQFMQPLKPHPAVPNFFELYLNQGMTVKNVTMEPRGIDDEDDRIVLHFAPDPSAKPFE
jgi:hypothetical protein